MKIDFTRYIAKFECVNIKDPEAMKKWFNDHPELSIHDHALIMKKSIATVRKYRTKTGFKAKTVTKYKSPVNTAVPPIIHIPENWRTKEWLDDNIAKYRMTDIARAIGLSYRRMYQICKKLKVKIRGGMKSNNPCCTHAWCYRHYVQLGYSAGKCATLANITRPKFLEWLIKFNIPVVNYNLLLIRNNINLNLKLALEKLYGYPLVKRIVIRKNHFKIYFKHTHTKIYYRENISDWKLDTILEPTYEFDQDMFNNGSLMLPYHPYKSLNKFEKIISLHLFMNAMIETGVKQPIFPPDILKSDYNNIFNISSKTIFRKGDICSFVKNRYGCKIMLHHFDITPHIKNLFKDRKFLNKIIRKRSNRKEAYLNEFNILLCCQGYKRGYRYKIITPAFFRHLFLKLGIKSVLDLSINHGSIGIACAMNNIKHYTFQSKEFDDAIAKGLKEIISLDHQEYNNELVDLVINYDFNGEDNIKKALAYSGHARRIVALVNGSRKEEYMELYNPTHVLKHIHYNGDKNDYLFIW